MAANDRAEKNRAAEEARQALAGRGGGRREAEDALNRYLASEAFHEYRRDEQDLEDEAPGDDEAGR